MGKWPEVLAVASKFEGKPIAFIVVNSGNPRATVASYLRQNRITWPTIVDLDRSFEKRCGIPEVSLKNILRVQIITPDGKMTSGNPGDVAASAARAVANAKWNIDPADIPAKLKASWAAVEFGNYSAAAVSLRRYLKARKPAEKAAAEKLQAYVTEKLEAQIELAASALRDEKNWDAYKTYSSIAVTFRRFEVPADVAKQVKTLRTDEAVKIELAALKKFQVASKTIAKAKSPTARQRGLKSLQRIIDNSPETEAATQAKAVIDSLSGTSVP